MRLFLLLPRSVLLLAVLESLRRAMNECVKEEEGVAEPEEGARYTKEASILYAGVAGSSCLSVSFGGSSSEVIEADERRLVVDDDAASESGRKSGVAWSEGGDRTPIVDGRRIESASCVEAIYWVIARGGGAIRFARFCWE